MNRILLFIFSLFFLGTLAAQTANPVPQLLFHADYRHGLHALYSKGCGRAFVPLNLQRTPQKGDLALPWNQYLAYPVAGNLDLQQGSILMDVTIGFTPGNNELPKGSANSFLFAIRNRTGQRLNAQINDHNGHLFFYVSNRNGKTSSVKLDVRNWKKGERKIVLCSWKRPGTITLTISGIGTKSMQNADLPDCPIAELHDIYIGSNAQVLPSQQYGKLGTWTGKISSVQIYGTYMSQTFSEMPKSALRNSAPVYPAAAASPEWVSSNRHRILLYLKQTKKIWKNNPVSVSLDLSPVLGGLSPAQRRAAVRSMRLAAADPETGKVLADPTGAIFRAFQWDDDFLTRMQGKLSFVHQGKLPVVYALYFDEKAPHDQHDPAHYPLPGSGSEIMVGRKDQPGNFGGGLRGAFAAHDFDGDHDVDLLFLSGSETDSGRDLFNGLYYYENLRNQKGYDLFAPPMLVDRGNNVFGHFRQTAPPRLADLDGDGKLDCVFASSAMPCYAQITLKNGVPVLHDWKGLSFDGPLPKLVSSPVLRDFNGDGLVDIFSDGVCYDNIGTQTQPRFSSRGKSLFAPGVAGKTEQIKHQDVHAQAELRNHYGENIRPLVWECADVNGDGKEDLLCGGWKSQVYYFLRRADGTFDAPAELRTGDGHELEFPGVFPYPLFADMNGDNAPDLLFSSEDGTLGCSYNFAAPGKPLKLASPVFLPEQRARINAGALAIPVAVDWDGDRKIDILSGGANGRVWFWKNIGTSDAPVFRNAVALNAGGLPLIWRAGPDGFVQGDQENDWGYLNIEAADWDGDGVKDLLVSGVRGEHMFYRNIGTPQDPMLAAGELITVDFPGETPIPAGFRYRPRAKELLSVHRSRPSVFDWNKDGLPDYIITNHRDRLALYLRYRRADGTLGLQPGEEIFSLKTPFFRTIVWNHDTLSGASPGPARMGRSATQIVDWDGDGAPDIIMDNINGRFLRNENGVFVDRGDLAAERLANHNTGPYAADLDHDGHLDLIVGTEGGMIHGFLRSYLEKDTPEVIPGKEEIKP